MKAFKSWERKQDYRFSKVFNRNNKKDFKLKEKSQYPLRNTSSKILQSNKFKKRKE